MKLHAAVMPDNPMNRNHSVIRDRLARFLTISVALHLCLMAGLRHSSSVALNRHLGQPVLDVQLQDYTPAAGVKPFSASTTVRPVTHVSGVRSIVPAETAAGPSASASYADDGTQASATATEGARHGLSNQLLGEIKTRLSHYLRYPALARKQGWEGTVWLGLRVEPDGQLDRIRLERSSGYAVLDDSALNSLQRIGQLAEARAWLEGRSIELQLPVIYRLIEN